MNLKLDKNARIKIAKQIGFDTPISLEKKNTILTGKKDEILRLKQKFKLNALKVYPNIICSTKKIYIKNKKISLSKPQSNYLTKDKGMEFLSVPENGDVSLYALNKDYHDIITPR